MACDLTTEERGTAGMTIKAKLQLQKEIEKRNEQKIKTWKIG